MSEWSQGEPLLADGAFSHEAYEKYVTDTNLASYLGSMIGAFPNQSYGFEAARAISRLDDSLLPLLVALVLSRSVDDWPQEEVLPLLQSVNSSSSTRMLEELALECVLPHVRVPAILMIAERDLARAESVTQRVWNSMDAGTQQWLEEDLAEIKAARSAMVESQSPSVRLNAGWRSTSADSLSGLITPSFEACSSHQSVDLSGFRPAVLGTAFQSIRGSFNFEMFFKYVGRLGRELHMEDLRAALPKASEALAVRPLEPVGGESGSPLFREVMMDAH
jgi:hypothetical protein